MKRPAKSEEPFAGFQHLGAAVAKCESCLGGIECRAHIPLNHRKNG